MRPAHVRHHSIRERSLRCTRRRLPYCRRRIPRVFRFCNRRRPVTCNRSYNTAEETSGLESDCSQAELVSVSAGRAERPVPTNPARESALVGAELPARTLPDTAPVRYRKFPDGIAGRNRHRHRNFRHRTLHSRSERRRRSVPRCTCWSIHLRPPSCRRRTPRRTAVVHCRRFRDCTIRRSRHPLHGCRHRTVRIRR